MLARVGLMVAAMGAAVGAALLVRRRAPEAPTQGDFRVPTQLDRSEFPSAQTPWLVVAFTSSTCAACEDVVAKASVLATREVGVVRIDFPEYADLHQRYDIDAVPTTVVADAEGVVRAAFLGPVKAQDLWAAVAECREPGSTPDHGEHGLGRGSVL